MLPLSRLGNGSVAKSVRHPHEGGKRPGKVAQHANEVLCLHELQSLHPTSVSLIATLSTRPLKERLLTSSHPFIHQDKAESEGQRLKGHPFCTSDLPPFPEHSVCRSRWLWIKSIMLFIRYFLPFAYLTLCACYDFLSSKASIHADFNNLYYIKDVDSNRSSI